MMARGRGARSDVSGPERSPSSWGRRILGGFGLLLIFAGSVVGGAVLHIDLPVSRRAAAQLTSIALSDLFEGSFHIERFERLNLLGLSARGFQVHDPAGNEVLRVEKVNARFSALGILTEFTLGSEPLHVRVSHARVEGAEALLLAGEQDVPTLVEAFALRKQREPSKGAETTGATVSLPVIEIGDAHVRARFEAAPPVDAAVRGARGSLSVTPQGTSLDFEPFGIHASGPEPLSANGLASIRVRSPGPVWAYFDGELGQLPLHLFGRLDGDVVKARVELPLIEPHAARALIPAWPFESSVAASAKATGRLPELQTELTAKLGGGVLKAKGPVTLDDGISLDLDVDTQGIDLTRLDPAWPATTLESKSALLFWSDGSQLSAELNGTIQPSEVNGVSVPAVDFRSTYDASGLELHGTLHEPGVPAHFNLRKSIEGDISFGARIRRARLENSPRLRQWVGAQGAFGAELEGTIRNGHVETRATLETTQLRWQDLKLGSARAVARARGSIDALPELRVTTSIESTDVIVGPVQLASLKATSEGNLKQLTVQAAAQRSDGARLQGSARIAPSPLVVHDARLGFTRRGSETTVQLRRADIGGNKVRLQGVRIESGGYLEGDASFGSGTYEVSAEGQDLDLGRLAEALGLPQNQLHGKLKIDGELRLAESSAGKLNVTLQDGSLFSVSGIDLDGSVRFDDKSSEGVLTGAIAGLGDIAAQWNGQLTGPPIHPESWLGGSGQLQLALEHVQLRAVRHALGLPELEQANGEAYVRLNLARAEAGAMPQAMFLLGTRGLAFSVKRRDDEPLNVDGIDVQVAGAVEGATGKLAATGRVFDHRGDVLTLSSELATDPDAVLRAVVRGRPLWPVVSDHEVRAVAIVPQRELGHLPAFARPAGYAGRGSARAVVKGTLAAPDVHLMLTAQDGAGTKAPFAFPLEGEGSLRYAVATGKLQGSVQARRNGVPVARTTFDLEAPWRSFVGPSEPGSPLWTGNAQLVLDGLPLELLTPLTARRVRGSAQGSIVISRRGWAPKVRADMNLRRLEIAGAAMGEGRLIADSSADAVLVRAHFEDEFGSLTTSLRAGVVSTPLALSFAEEKPLRVTLEARHYDARVVSPFVHDILPELSGPLDGTLEATFEPPPAEARNRSDGGEKQPWQARLSGNMRLSGGTVEPQGLGLRLLDTHLTIQAARENEYNVISLNDIRARANSDSPNLRASGKVYLRNLDIEHARFEIEQQAVPLAPSGARIADLTGNARAVVERTDEELAMDILIPRMLVELPPQAERPLIELEDNPAIEVLQATTAPQPDRESAAPSTPWRIRFRLGDQVRVRNRLLNLQLRGAPEVHIAEETRVTGAIDLVQGGRVTVLGRIFIIDQGRITFDTDDPANPHLNVTATWRAPNGILVMANLQGTPRVPTLSWTSDPGLPGGEQEVIALVLGAGGGESRDGTGGANIAAAVATEVLGQVGPERVELSVSRDTGTAEGRVASMSERTWDTVTATYQLSERVWVEGSYLRPHDTAGTITDQDPGFSGAVDWRFHRDWSLRTEAGNLGTGVDLLWRYRY